jgi:hypothetical protein
MYHLVGRERDGLEEYADLERRFESVANRDGITTARAITESEE